MTDKHRCDFCWEQFDSAVALLEQGMTERRTIRVVFEFSVEANADDEQVAEAVFDRLADWKDAPYVSCDGWDPVR